MGYAGQNIMREIGEDRFHRLSGHRRSFRQPRLDLSRQDLRTNRIGLDAFQIIRHPVDELMGMAAKCLVLHVECPGVFRSLVSVQCGDASHAGPLEPALRCLMNPIGPVLVVLSRKESVTPQRRNRTG